jgi:gliding motility-associated-like protein
VDTVVVTFIPQGDAAFNYGNNAYCQNEMPLTPWAASLAGSYSSDPSGLSIDPTDGTIAPSLSEPGTYWVYHTIDGPCLSQDSTQVTIHGTASADWTTPSALCAGEQQSIVLADLITGSTSGTWSGPHVVNGIFTADVYGEFPISYAVTEGSCTSTTTHIIVVLDTPAANAGNDLSTCTSSIQLQATPTTDSGSWQLPAGLSATSINAPNATITSTTIGTYTLTWTVSNEACSASDQVEITFLDPGTGVTVDAGPDQTIEQFSPITLAATATDGAELQWTILQGTGTLLNANAAETIWQGTSTGDHVAMITASVSDCASVTDTVHITVLDLFIPAGFSPNGDGVNDVFEITGLSAYSERALKVFNRWGQEVYTNDTYANEWDGRSDNGQHLSNGTYFYILNLGGPSAYNGPVIIKR